MLFLVLTAIEVNPSTHLQSPPSSTEHFLCLHGVQCYSLFLEMEVCPSSGNLQQISEFIDYAYNCTLLQLTDGFWYYSVSLEVQGYLTIRCALKLTPRLHSIRASFCPLLSLEKGEYIGMPASFICCVEVSHISEVDLLL